MKNSDHFQSLAFTRKADLTPEEYKDIEDYLEEQTDSQLINIYNMLRDEMNSFSKVRHFYPNIQYLHATPFEREKDRREQGHLIESSDGCSSVVAWYREAKEKSCIWWLENHIVAKHALTSCMNCGACTALCPASEFYDFSPRVIMTVVQEKEEEKIIELLKSETLWYCHQCGSCKTKCPRRNSPFSMISSLRQLSQLKGYHIESIRGRQQYFARHLWGGNLWKRACTLYFRNPVPDNHKDFGPRFARYYKNQDNYMKKVGAHPDMEGPFSGRKVNPATLNELRKLWVAGGAVFLWSLIDKAAERHASSLKMTVEEYHDKVKQEG